MPPLSSVWTQWQPQIAFMHTSQNHLEKEAQVPCLSRFVFVIRMFSKYALIQNEILLTE